MIRRLFLALTLGLSLAATGASAQSAAEKATVDAAKTQGVVGEQGDGFLGLVTGSAPADVTAAMAAINAGRAKAYQDIAAKTGVSQAAAGEATAIQLVGRLPAGAYYKPLGGSWTRK
ncbi:YdbL family protein [Phenylobacterium montanum]|uniref:YdbL family protein n=1 Tax=Phenylobacterium montanum TaxID=2823693 RepID=A0A975IVP4_9CAUL|nr:YdbL family protein [Caulobacter sp. S6]QUD89058.1 YdbL family protein [Caulobacter sp. S6]